jgi:PAS domain-containing protein
MSRRGSPRCRRRGPARLPFRAYTFAWLSAALLGYLGWHLWHLWQLESWLRRKLGEPPRDAPGLWGGVFAQLHRLRLQSRARKKRLARVLKEFRKSTQALPDAGVVLDMDHGIAWLNGRRAPARAAPGGSRPAHREPAARARVRGVPA